MMPPAGRVMSGAGAGPSAPHPALTRRGEGITADGQFYLPTRVLFGRGIAGQAGVHAAGFGGRVMLVTDPGVAAAGLTGPVREHLTAAGLEVLDFQQVEPNPRDVDCLAGADLARGAAAGLFVAVGGGSAIDSAKCISLLVTNGGHPRDWEDFGALGADPLPVIAIPTTAGTGSEVSPSAVITDTARKKKMNLFDLRNCPRIALVDPDLTLTCPPPLTAAAGLDALSHAIDALHCRLATPASDALALEGARLVALYIRRAFARPGDVEARCGMAQGSLTAGIAVGLTDVAGAHCLAEAIGGLYGHPHGYCCARGLPPIMEYNLPASQEKYARLAGAFGIERGKLSARELAQLAIGFVRQLNRDLGVPPMRQLIRVQDLRLLGEKAAQNTSTPSNPRAADAEAFTAMFARELELDPPVVQSLLEVALYLGHGAGLGLAGVLAELAPGAALPQQVPVLIQRLLRGSQLRVLLVAGQLARGQLRAQIVLGLDQLIDVAEDLLVVHITTVGDMRIHASRCPWCGRSGRSLPQPPRHDRAG